MANSAHKNGELKMITKIAAAAASRSLAKKKDDKKQQPAQPVPVGGFGK
jgi:hypothetical protein